MELCHSNVTHHTCDKLSDLFLNLWGTYIYFVYTCAFVFSWLDFGFCSHGPWLAATSIVGLCVCSNRLPLTLFISCVPSPSLPPLECLSHSVCSLQLSTVRSPGSPGYSVLCLPTSRMASVNCFKYYVSDLPKSISIYTNNTYSTYTYIGNNCGTIVLTRSVYVPHLITHAIWPRPLRPDLWMTALQSPWPGLW